VAIDVPTPVRRHLARATQTLCERFPLRVVPEDQLHLTLLFAGELPDDHLEDLAEIVRTTDLPPLEFSLGGLGHFPPRGMPRVVFASLTGDVQALEQLHHTLTRRAEPLGIERERRGFTPHITLARVTSQFGALALVDRLKEVGKDLNTKPFRPTAMVLYESRLFPKGPEHTPVVHRSVPPPPLE
jgi:RNA 2',3'-cyclic 3'-phosphodiesterase